MEFEDLTSKVIGCAVEVHRQLGPGMLESAYEQCLAHEFVLNRIIFKRQISLPVHYKGVQLDCGYRLDFLVEDKLIIELKAVEAILPIHKAQLLSYLKISELSVGLLINFNVALLKDGITRMVL
ncbi:MAG: GxxExxY protein [Pseudomonadota bacterium]